MRNALLIAHIAAAVLLIGPATFAASAFPRQAAAAGDGDSTALGAARVLHRVSRGYGTASLVVGAIGVALAQQSSWWSEPWVWIALVVFTLASILLLVVIVPTQARLLHDAERSEQVDAASKARLHSTTGLYSMAWVVVLALMVIKPG